MRPHVSAETMARYRQGDLNQRRTSHIGTHLAGCDRCSALNEDLGGVTTLLASADPPPMPEDLTARISSAIAAESARRAPAPITASARSGDSASTASTGLTAGTAPVARRHRPPRRSRSPRFAPKVVLGGLAAAAAVVLVGGGLYEVGHTGSTDSTASSGAPSAPRSATRSPTNGPMAAALPFYGPALPYQRNGRRETITPITSSANFTPAGLSSQVTAEVKKYGAGFTKTGTNAQSSGRHGLASPAAVPGAQTGTFADIPLASLRGCVNRIAAGTLVLLVDVARYRGAPATIIVTEAAKTGPMQIWVVGTGCSASSSDLLHHATAITPN